MASGSDSSAVPTTLQTAALRSDATRPAPLWTRNPSLLARPAVSPRDNHQRSVSCTATRSSSMRTIQSPTSTIHSTADDSTLPVSTSDEQAGESYPPIRPSSANPHNRSSSHPSLSTAALRSLPAHWHHNSTDNDPWRLPPLPRAESPLPRTLPSRPRASIGRLASLDDVLTYRQQVSEWKRTSTTLDQRLNYANLQARFRSIDDQLDEAVIPDTTVFPAHVDSMVTTPWTASPRSPTPGIRNSKDLTEVASLNQARNSGAFRHPTAHVGFVAAISLMMLLSEYLISGFAVELSNLVSADVALADGGMGTFWPATLLTLILSATLLVFARLADRYGGYPLFMFGTIWLMIWTLIPGLSQTLIIIDVARAMQGLACAAFVPSTFSMMGVLYPEGHTYRNVVFGIYSACAPLGFYLGFLTSSLLPDDKPGWYFFVGTVVSFIALVAAYLAVPHDNTDRSRLNLEMDWLGALLITSGLILVAYALAQYPYLNRARPLENSFARPAVIMPFLIGMVCLIIAVWVEGWYATSPLLPFDFFKPDGVLSVCFAGLCFYAAYGVWLYCSTCLFHFNGVHDGRVAVWYIPMAAGGLFFALASGYIVDRVPVMAILLFSAGAWVAAPLLLALSPTPLPYWAFVFPSMLCATAGVDLTYTISIIFFSAVQPLKYQGLAGAVCSILINLAMSFSLSITEIIETKSLQSGFSIRPANDALQHEIGALQAALLYATVSSTVGFLICVLFVRISNKKTSPRKVDEEHHEMEHGPRPQSSEAPTLVGAGDEQDDLQLHRCK